MKKFIVLLFIVFLEINAQAQLRCANLFSNQNPTQIQSGRDKIRDLQTFGHAMTTGMVLGPHQATLFDIYRNVFFGNPDTPVKDYTLEHVTSVLTQYPNLKKVPFQEYEIEIVRKVYDTTEKLEKHLKSQNKNSGQVRSNLFQIEANFGFWKKLVYYEDPPMPENLTKDQRRKFQEQQNSRFLRYFDRIISKKNRILLKSETTDYRLKIKTLYKVLNRISNHMEKRGRDNRLLRQSMVDLVATTGFNNRATQDLLKRKNALDKIEGLKKILNERDDMAVDLGFVGRFDELLEVLRIDSPSFSEKSTDESKLIKQLEIDVLAKPEISRSLETVRVRSLSIQEAPFRACLGNDCSSRTYFSMAFDPNFNYFTITDENQHSSGHATVVLGTAKDQEGQEQKVAFLDKLQNVPIRMIPHFLEAVRLSLWNKGYLLGIPEDASDVNKISNTDAIVHFINNDVWAKLHRKQLTNFTPHPNEYPFKEENLYSRAYKRFSVKPYELIRDETSEEEIHPGQSYEPYPAEETLNNRTLAEDLIRLRESNQEQDILQYISSGHIIDQIEKLGIFSKKEFLTDLIKISSDSRFRFPVRKKAFFEILLISTNQTDSIRFPTSQEFNFSDAEIVQMNSEIRQWKKSSDENKKQFEEKMNENWFKSARYGNEVFVKGLLLLRLVDINQKNRHGYTALTVASRNHQLKIIEKLLLMSDRNIDISSALDHALALGHKDIIQLVQKIRPDIKLAPNERATSRIHQEMNFVRVEGGTFKMGNVGVSTTISGPTLIMSTPITQMMYLKLMGRNPAKFKEGENTAVMMVGNELHALQPDNPVENISHEESVRLMNRLNELSKQDDPLIYDLIPEHVKSAQYDFATEAQIEHVMKKAKTEDGDTIDEMIKRGDSSKLGQYVVFSNNSGNTTQPVHSKKPLFVDGKPIYDLNGNVATWVSDWHDNRLFGGVDPHGPSSAGSGFDPYDPYDRSNFKPTRVYRGGSWNSPKPLDSTHRNHEPPARGSDSVGLRLVMRTPH